MSLQEPFSPSTDTSPRMNRFVSQFNLSVQIYLVPFKLWVANLATDWEFIVSRSSGNFWKFQILLKTSPNDEISYHLIYRQQRLVKQLQIGYRSWARPN